MSRYKAYAEYKDSGVEWLGNVPSHWTICRVKNVATINPSKSEARRLLPDSEVSFIPMEAIGDKGELDASRVKVLSDVLTGYTYVADGDLMIAKITPCFENGKSAIAKNLVNGIGFATTEVIPIRPEKSTDASFLFYALNCNPFKSVAESSMYGAGGQKRVADSFVAEYHLSFPTESERVKIANFLDHETTKIDLLIEKQQNLIALLKEKRQAVISHAVTKGLNPNIPMKDSGVEWLGEVPEHWVVTKAKFLFDFITSGSRGWAEYYSDEGELFFRIANLTRDTITPKLESIQNVSPPNGSEGERSRIKLNDILISITADLGSVCVANAEVENGYVSQHVALCRPNSKVNSPEWLGFYVLSDIAKEQLIGSGYGGTKVQLSLEDIRELVVLLPTETEQPEIAKYITDKMARFSRLVEVANAQIEYLQERRTALISAAVTGKIDVRDWQQPHGNSV